MSESSANIRLAASSGEAHTHPHPAAPLANHAASVADSNALPPALTPATTTRQSVAVGVFSTLWGHSPASTHETVNIAIPSSATYADAHEQHNDLAASTGSVPSTTTTLTNTLPPLQSAAIRALNAPAFHAQGKPAKSTSSKTTITSQPVVVRTYSGSRHTSRPGSGFTTPRSFAMSGQSNASALSAGLARQNEQLPAIEDFSFSAILRAVDPEIRDAIDAIAEICARSRLSLADEYDAHLPPQGEITGAGPGWAASTGALAGRSRLSRISQGWTAADNVLMAVPEASSSSERLAQEGRGTTSDDGKRKRSRSAYGSLKSVISGGSGGKRNSLGDITFTQSEATSSRQETQQRPQGPAWTIRAASKTEDHPAITIETMPQASKQLAFDTSALQDLPETDSMWGLRPRTPISQRAVHRRNWSTPTFSLGQSGSRTRSNTITTLASWLPWPRTVGLNQDTQQELTKAETRLREMLIHSQGVGTGKATAGAV